MRVISVIVPAVLALSSLASASEFSSRDEVDLGATNNAYLTKDLPKSDMFARFATSNSLKSGDHDIGLRISYTDFFNEKPNDVINWRVGDEYKPDDWSFAGAVIGQRYPSGSPASTDTTFDNIGLELRADTENEVSDSTEFDYGVGYRFRDYTGFANRLDNTAFGSVILQYSVNPKFTISGTGDVEAIFSTQTDYSRLYFSVGGIADYKLPCNWMWTSELALSTSQYLSRTISTVVETFNRKGVKVTNIGVDKEGTTTVYLSTGALKSEGQNFRWGAEINLTSQASRSGSQDYSALTILGKAVIIF